LLEFIANYKPNDVESAELSESVLLSHKSPALHMSVRGFLKSTTLRLSALLLSGKIVSFAWTMTRECRVMSNSKFGISIGLVTTREGFRGKNYGSILLKHIEMSARQCGAEFIYLQGIINFYSKFGFRGFAPKSKFLFNVAHLPTGSGSIRAAELTDVPILEQLFEEYSKICNGFAMRRTSDWMDMIGPLSSTFLFCTPYLILDESSKILGYYCASPDDRTTVREFVPSIRVGSAEAALAVIAKYLGTNESGYLEIFAPDKGPVRRLAESQIAADFIRYYRPSSSNMIKWLPSKLSFPKIDDSFIFQGDNL
jgi:hypothetical protein